MCRCPFRPPSSGRAASSPSTNPAEAFEDLRREISLQRTAIEGLTAAKDKVPDYSPTLREMKGRLDQIDQQIASINDKPSMCLTPESIAVRLAEAAISVRAEDRAAIGEARDALARMLGRAEGMIKEGRSTEVQDWWTTWAATGGVLLGALLALIGVAAWS